MHVRKVFKYELKNILRSKLVVLWSILLFLLSISFIRISGDFDKAVLALFSVLSVITPLIAMLFAGVYWYYSDKFTQLVLTMPVQRAEFFGARWLALNLGLSVSLCAGLLPAFLFYGGISKGLLFACALGVFLVVVFVTLGLFIAIMCPDRMKGIGVILGLWLYFVIVHDGILLVVLVLLRDYPLDIASALAASLNPIGLVRVSLLLQFDAPLLLSQTGAIVRKMVTSWESYAVGLALGGLWIFIPAYFARRSFKRCDF